MIPAYWVTLVILILFFRADPNNPFSGGIKVDGWKDGLAVFLLRADVLPEVVLPRHHVGLHAERRGHLLPVVPVYTLLVRRWCRGCSLDQKLRRELYALARGGGVRASRGAP